MARYKGWVGWTVLGLVMMTAPASMVWGQTSTVPIGGQIQANDYTTGSQTGASVGMGPDGSFVVVWQSSGSANGDDDGESIQARRYAADGSPIGNAFLVNSDPSGYQFRPAVATDGTGDFIVVWMDTGAALYRPKVEARRFASDGSPKGPEFLVSATGTLENQDDRPAVAVAPDGRFVVVRQRFELPLPVMGRLWQPEYYDRYIRNHRHLLNAMSYVEQNPVASAWRREGLETRPEL